MPLHSDDDAFVGFTPTDEWRQPDAVEQRERLQLVAQEAKRRKSPFQRIAFGELRERKARALDWIVDDWMLAREVSFLAGESEAGKTFMAIDVALRTALGWPVFGRRTKPGLVIYQIGESESGLLDLRIPAWVQHFGSALPDKVPFVVLPSRVNLWTQDERDPLGMAALMREIEEICGDWPGLSLSALYVDTFNKAFAGGNENDQRDVSRVVGNAETIAKTFGCHVPIIHHFPKGGATLRGHSSMRADVHAVAMISTDQASKIRTVRFDNGGKLKDGEKSSMQFELMQVKLGEREGDGKPITSCVVLPAGEKAKEREATAGAINVTKGENTFLRAFFAAIDKDGFLPPAGFDCPADAKIVDYEIVRATFYEMNPPQEVDGQLDEDAQEQARRRHKETIRKALKRASDDLARKMAIGVRMRVDADGKETYLAWWKGRPIRGFPRTYPPKPKRPEDNADTVLAEGTNWLDEVF